MAVINQEVNFDMLEKKTDGSFKKKNPSTKAEIVKLTSNNFVSDNVQDAMNELFLNVSNGKGLIATAITGKGISTSGSESFSSMSAKINSIKTASVLTGNAVAAQVLAGNTFYSNNPDSKLTGTMPNRGAYNQTITTQGGKITIPQGYHNGAGGITASFANLVAGNVKAGVNIGGVIGTMVGLKTAHGTPTGSFFTTPIIFGFKPKFFIHITDNPSSVEYHISMYSDGTLYPPINDVGGGFGYKFTPLPDGISWNSAVLLSKGSYFAVG